MFYNESVAPDSLKESWHCVGSYGRSDIMRFELDPAQDLGLQHALKNGVAVLQGADFDPARRTQVLDGLLEIVSDAGRGSDAMNEQSLTFALNDRPAVERFSLFLRYLGDSVDDIGGKLASTKHVLEGLEAGQDVDPDERLSAEDLLSRLLTALERERALNPLTAPREFHYN
jgi:hypothetical protein